MPSVNATWGFPYAVPKVDEGEGHPSANDIHDPFSPFFPPFVAIDILLSPFLTTFLPKLYKIDSLSLSLSLSLSRTAQSQQ
jgi:hypothetical protein